MKKNREDKDQKTTMYQGLGKGVSGRPKDSHQKAKVELEYGCTARKIQPSPVKTES